MHSPTALKLEDVYEDDQYLNNVLSHYCLQRSNGTNPLVSGEVPSTSKLTSGSKNEDERHHDNTVVVSPDTNSLVLADEKVSPWSHATSHGSEDYCQTTPTDSGLPAVDQLLRCFDVLHGRTWSSIEMLQGCANKNVKKFLQSIRTLNKMKPCNDYDDLQQMLRSCEEIVNSVSRRCDNTSDLQMLDFLEAILKSNIQVISVVHSWDDTLRRIRRLFKSYKVFNSVPEGERLSSFFSAGSTDFNHTSALEIRDTLIRLMVIKPLSSGGSLQFKNMTQVFDELLAEYGTVIDGISSDLANAYFAPCGQYYDAESEASLPDAEYIFSCYVQLFAEVFDCSNAVNMILDCLSSSIGKRFSLEFSVIWEMHDMPELAKMVAAFTGEDVATLVTALSKVVSSFLELFSKSIQCRKERLQLLFSKMEHQGLLPCSTNKVSSFICRIFNIAIRNIDVFEEVLGNVSEEVFASAITEVLNYMDSYIEDVINNLPGVNIKEGISGGCLMPNAIVDRYVRILYEHCNKNQMELTSSHDDSLESAVIRYDDMISCSSHLRIASNGFLMSTNEPCGYNGFAWIYNRFVFWRLMSLHETLMSDFMQMISNNFVELLSIDYSKEMNMDIEFEYHTLLTTILHNNKHFKDTLKENIIPCLRIPCGGATLYSTIANHFSGEQEIPLEYLSPDLRSFICEDNALEEIAQRFSTDVNVVSTLVSYLVQYIAGKASAIMAEYYVRDYKNASTDLAKADIVQSPQFLFIGEYFTTLLSKYSEDEVVDFKILGKAYTRFIDTELERLADARPYDDSLRKFYRVDIEHLILIARYCSAEVVDSLELLLEGC
ncbi:hypothetical protein X943_002254 [Babesia divergens]|uniref:Uncharacterized protein n=1 Tax=Babesia divergens TaxID=32595 RepID=A0AAD9LH67_BABDI|nr:hypothetical protein X943_002254 [Babesia divergens]